MQVLTVLFGAAVVIFLGWRGVDWAVREFVTENPAFATKKIDLQTDGVLTAEALRKWGRVRVGENLMSLDLSLIKRDLELVPLIQSAAVERVLPDTLRIRVTERVPVAQVAVARPDASGRYTTVIHLLDATGFVMLPPDRTMVADPTALQMDWLPELRGVNDVDLKLGRQVESAQVRSALRLLGRYERSVMFGRADIRRVDVTSAEILTATTSAGSEITFASQRDFDTQLRQLARGAGRVYTAGQGDPDFRCLHLGLSADRVGGRECSPCPACQACETCTLSEEKCLTSSFPKKPLSSSASRSAPRRSPPSWAKSPMAVA